jgi:hypothetical protein
MVPSARGDRNVQASEFVENNRNIVGALSDIARDRDSIGFERFDIGDKSLDPRVIGKPEMRVGCHKNADH